MKYLLVVIAIFAQLINAQTWHSFQEYEYLVVYKPYANSYAEAKAGCAARNATVANVKTKVIQNFLVKKINLTEAPYSLYIGAVLNKNTNNFQWTDGTIVHVGQWKSNEPNNYDGKENCVIMGWIYELDPSYKWSDVPCSYHLRYICQRCGTACIPITTTTRTTSAKPTSTTTPSTTSSTLETSKQLTSETSIITTTATSQETTEVPVTDATQSTSGNILDNYLMFVVISAAGGCVFGATLMTIVCIFCRKRERREAESNLSINEYEEIDKRNQVNTTKQSEKAIFSKDATVNNNTAIVRHSYISLDDTIVVEEKCVNVEDKEESPHEYAAISNSNKTEAYEIVMVEKNAFKSQETNEEESSYDKLDLGHKQASVTVGTSKKIGQLEKNVAFVKDVHEMTEKQIARNLADNEHNDTAASTYTTMNPKRDIVDESTTITSSTDQNAQKCHEYESLAHTNATAMYAVTNNLSSKIEDKGFEDKENDGTDEYENIKLFEAPMYAVVNKNQSNKESVVDSEAVTVENNKAMYSVVQR